MTAVAFWATLLGVTVIISFITYYSLYFDWHRSDFGVLMNLALIFTVLIVLGLVIIDTYLIIGSWIVVLGWLGMSVSLILRAFLIHETAEDIRAHTEAAINDAVDAAVDAAFEERTPDTDPDDFRL